MTLLASICWPVAEPAAAGVPTIGQVLQGSSPGTDCTVTPRRRRDLVELANAPLGTARLLESGVQRAAVASVAGGLPDGERATAEADAVRAVKATARELAACYNAGDLRRLFALYSRGYLFEQWGGFAGPDPSPAQVNQAIAFISDPVPLPAGQRIETVTVEEVWRLPEGRIAAVVSLDDVRLLLLLLYTDGWYQVEEAFDLTGDVPTAP